jgi:hypothetical protein
MDREHSNEDETDLQVHPFRRRNAVRKHQSTICTRNIELTKYFYDIRESILIFFYTEQTTTLLFFPLLFSPILSFPLTMFDIIINVLLSVVYSAVGSIFSVDTLQSVFYFVSSVISSENAVVAAVPTALLGAGAVLSLVTGKTRRFNPRTANNNGGGFFSYQGLFWAFLGIAFCFFIRWPVTSIITIIFGVAQAYLGWIKLEPSWKLLAQATMTWILSAIVAHHITKAFKSCYQKVISTICTAVTILVVGAFRTVSSTVTWLFRLVLGLLVPSRFGHDSTAEEAEVEHEVEHHQVNYDMEDYVYDSDYDHEAESESDVEYDSDDYESDDDSFTASTDDTDESSLLEDWHLDEPHQARHCMEEVHENGTYVSTYDLMSGAASILRCSPRLRGKPSPCYTKGKIDYSMRCN